MPAYACAYDRRSVPHHMLAPRLRSPSYLNSRSAAKHKSGLGGAGYRRARVDDSDRVFSRSSASAGPLGDDAGGGDDGERRGSRMSVVQDDSGDEDYSEYGGAMSGGGYAYVVAVPLAVGVPGAGGGGCGGFRSAVCV